MLVVVSCDPEIPEFYTLEDESEVAFGTRHVMAAL